MPAFVWAPSVPVHLYQECCCPFTVHVLPPAAAAAAKTSVQHTTHSRTMETHTQQETMMRSMKNVTRAMKAMNKAMNPAKLQARPLLPFARVLSIAALHNAADR